MAGRTSTPRANKRQREPDDGDSVSTRKKRRVKASDNIAANAPSFISTAIKGALNLGRRVISGAGRDPWEIPDSDDESSVQSRQSRKPSRAKTSTTSNEAVYDVPDSPDELNGTAITPVARQKKSTTASETKPKTSTKAAESAKPKRGRPPRKAVDQDREEPAARDTPTKPQSVGRATQMRSKATRGDPVKETPTRRGRPSLGQKLGVGQLRASDTPSSEPGTFEEAISKASSTKPGRGRKAVAQKPEPPSKESEESEESEDDEVCIICSKPDSELGNEILFCDNCDKGYHQKCCEVTTIPKGDWFCRDCSQEGAGAVFVEAKAASETDERPDIPNFDQHLAAMQRVLLDRCSGRRRIKLRGQDEAREKAHTLVEQTIVAGEGNSMLVIGPRGCGKTTLVESIVSDMSGQHKGEFHVVRLNGFIHTDDKLALREIWRQLGKEMEVEDELINKTNNYADTMASLLALLSHPSEIAESHEGVTSKSVIFIIDEFDLFATHARQTLLYNLFDIAQAKKAPIAVLGLTTRIDVVETLEKRVKSRFSHRYVYLSLPKILAAFWDVCRQGLTVDEEDMASEGLDTSVEGHQQFWEWWNNKLEALHKTRQFQDHLETHFYSTKSVLAFLGTCILPLSTLSPTSLLLRIPPGAGVGVLSLDPPDSKLQVLEALSELDLSMLIAAARLDIVAHTDTVNFAMAYDEYTSLMARQRVQSAAAGMPGGGGTRVWGRGVASMAWERLVTLGMLMPAATVGRGAAGQSGLDAKMWKVDVALEEIPAAVRLSTLLGKWCREI
ncbi:origin recognition complex subunit 4 [Echria macrotheca]|uniref:Origin recognition complex subunit 4 n=1 Tax=Echria macrotheca TaxID=438768 RepID=A0AAJ0BJI7_9PEZI|nr:origin recognition complex subunit 4 [Echria macrotheca]